MSKKQKRKVSQGTRRSGKTSTTAGVATAPAEHQSTSQSGYTPSTRKSGAPRFSGSPVGMGSRRFMPTPEFNPDYSYIKRDLKRIGILAGSFLGILIILSFIIK
jgi:hypothetical protein